jgi:hypothetical protein
VASDKIKLASEQTGDANVPRHPTISWLMRSGALLTFSCVRSSPGVIKKKSNVTEGGIKMKFAKYMMPVHVIVAMPESNSKGEKE